MGRPTPPEECANCGEPIPRNARACPGCGADERTGWRETSIYDGLDLPEEDAPTRHTDARRPMAVIWKVIAVVLVIIVVTGSLLLRR
jgi:uncharacterized membrane protein YvbJ